jgi:hypothetical protein
MLHNLMLIGLLCRGNLHHAISPAAWWKRLLQPLISLGQNQSGFPSLSFNSEKKKTKDKKKTHKSIKIC